MKPKEVIELAHKNDVKFIDLKFIDFPGVWQHTTLPVARLDEGLFEDGIQFDGSSVRGWQPINASDMTMIPDPETAKLDPFFAHPTLSLVCSVFDPITKQPYSRDPRHISKKAEAYLRQTGIADTSFMGPEAEFFLFDDVRFDHSKPNEGYYFLDSVEGAWNSGREEYPNLGYKTRHKEGYFPVPPTDTLANVRMEIMLALQASGIEVEVGHHEVASGGQCEIGMKFNRLLPCADQLMWFKYVVKNVARKHGKAATFMPKPLFGDNGSGMHVHQSLWKEGKPLFHGDGYAGLSQTALHYIGGIIKHAKSLAAFTNPTTNSYKRLVPGFEAPSALAYSQRNRSAAIRIPVYSSRPDSKRIEYRMPDGAANPYLAFSAILMAMLDGIRTRTNPGPPLDKDIYDLAPEQLRDVPKPPGSLDEALTALQKDHEFLMHSDVFTEDVIETWIAFKRKEEVDAIRLRPHPYEFALYFDS
ncbi:MAG: type I glutamate--ammonia ligase [Labilithrix sp.]|nr:type I glutamate--ammonia ligase [Labilithrix sp.]